MNFAYLDPTLDNGEKEKACNIIKHFEGEITCLKEKANLIIKHDISISERSERSIRTISSKCLMMFYREVINPFSYNSENLCLQNIFLRNKSFCFINCSEANFKRFSNMIHNMDGNISNENPDFFISDKLDIELETLNCISVNWIEVLYNSSFYRYPQKYLITNLKQLKEKVEIKTSENSILAEDQIEIPIENHTEYPNEYPIENPIENPIEKNLINSEFKYNFPFVKLASDIQKEFKYS